MKPSQGARRLTIVGIVMLLFWPAIGEALTKGEQLRQTMADIALLSNQLAQRKADAAGIRDKLTVRRDEIKSEARELMRQKSITTESAAATTPKLWYDLMLIAEISTYMDRYKQRIDYYRVAIDRLSYLYQQADDDLKIVNTLSGLKIDALVAQADKIIESYLPDAQTLLIQPANLVIDPPETIWRDLVSKP